MSAWENPVVGGPTLSPCTYLEDTSSFYFEIFTWADSDFKAGFVRNCQIDIATSSSKIYRHD